MREGVVPFRVRYPEVDRMGFAHHGNYLVWFELGRTELMREAGVPYSEVEARGLYFPVVEAGARFRLPAYYDDELEVRTIVLPICGATVRFEYRIVRPKTAETLTTGFSVHAATDARGKPGRIPKPLVAALAAWSGV